jgi:hypothetical protein
MCSGETFPSHMIDISRETMGVIRSGEWSPRHMNCFARDEERFARDEERFARDEERFARDEEGAACVTRSTS